MNKEIEKDFEKRVDGLYKKLGIPVPVHKEYKSDGPLEMTKGQSPETSRAIEKLLGEKQLTPEEKILVSDFSKYLAQYGHSLQRDFNTQEQLVAYDELICFGSIKELHYLVNRLNPDQGAINKSRQLVAFDEAVVSYSTRILNNIKTSININAQNFQLIANARASLAAKEIIFRTKRPFDALKLALNRERWAVPSQSIYGDPEVEKSRTFRI